MPDREKVIRIIDELIFEAQKEPNWKAESALKCLKKELLKEQEVVKCQTDHDNELTRHVLFTTRQHVEECLNKARVRYGEETAEFLMFAKGVRDACLAIDELISTHNEGTEQNDE